MDEYEVVNGVIQTKPQTVDISVVQKKLTDAQNSLAQAQAAKAQSDSDMDATIATWQAQVDSLTQIINSVTPSS